MNTNKEQISLATLTKQEYIIVVEFIPYLVELVRNLVAHGDAREGETGEWSG